MNTPLSQTPQNNPVAEAPSVDTPANTTGDRVPVSDIIDLPRGKELTEASAVALAKARPVRWVVIAGPVRSGKTTLLTSIYELFQWGKVPNYIFAGSTTLPAFEERCHLARIESEGEEEDTPRTLYDDQGPKYLHLRVAAAKGDTMRVDFLFTDVSGEMFAHVRDSTNACKDLAFLRRAGNFILLLDSKKALRTDKRWAVIEEAKTILRSCLDSQMLSADCVVTVLWSKFDYFVETGDKSEDQAFRKQIAQEFDELFGKRVSHLNFGEVAARPSKARKLGFGKGTVELLDGWITFSPGARAMDLLPEASGTRESELFAARHFDKHQEP
jgi:hypothetical protein